MGYHGALVLSQVLALNGVGPSEEAIGRDQPFRFHRAGGNSGAYFACDLHRCGCVQGRHSSLSDPNGIDCIDEIAKV